MSILDDTVIVVPSKRKPPLQTLLSFPTERKVILISDPDMMIEHMNWIEEQGMTNVKVVQGKKGMIPQSAECYRAAWREGYKFYFRMDDDLHPKFFVGMEKDWFPTLDAAMLSVRNCQLQTGLSLCGFVNSSVRIWMKQGYGRSYGLIHGGCHLCIAVEDPSKYINEELPAYEDVYRSAAHREVDGAVGRVNYIGLDKRSTLRASSMSKTPEVQARAKEIILTRFPDTVTCDGERVLDGGQQTIPNWRLVAGPWYVK